MKKPKIKRLPPGPDNVRFQDWAFVEGSGIRRQVREGGEGNPVTWERLFAGRDFRPEGEEGKDESGD